MNEPRTQVRGTFLSGWYLVQGLNGSGRFSATSVSNLSASSFSWWSSDCLKGSLISSMGISSFQRAPEIKTCESQKFINKQIYVYHRIAAGLEAIRN